MENNIKKRPSPAEKRQISCKLSHKAYDWTDGKRWGMRCTLSSLVNKTVEFAILHEEEFLEFFEETKYD